MKTKQFLFALLSFPILLSAVVKTTNQNGNWNNPSVWTPSGVPLVGDKVKIYHTLMLNQNFTTSDTIFVYNVLSISANRILTLNPGTMVLINNATYNGRLGWIDIGGQVVGDFIFQKWITRCDGYSTYGSPFTVLKTNFNWYYCYQCMGPSWSNIYYYDETVPGIQDLGCYDNIGSNIDRGRGFFYWFSNYSGGQNFARQIALKGAINFTTTFDFNVTNTPSSSGAAHDGYNLVSNPFPGTIDWLASSWTKSKVNNAIYVWNSCANSYGSYVAGVGVNGGSRYIPSMQGFWIQTNDASPKLRIKSDAMVSGAQGLLKTNSDSDTVNYVLRLTLNNDEIAIRLDSNSTSNLDSLTDARKFFSDSSKICSSNYLGSEDYSVNAIKDSSNSVPIKIKGSGVLTFNGIHTFHNHYSIYLKDLLNNKYQAITEGMQYSFTDTSLVTFNKRFEVQFIKNSTVGIKSNSDIHAKLSYNQENIFISLSSEVELPFTVKMVDLLGREVYSKTFNEREVIIQKNNVSTILTVYNHQERFVKRIF